MLFSFSIILFFLDFKLLIAVSSKLGANITSKNKLLIFSEVFKSIFEFDINTPPKAETGSPSRAAS